jgi:hypothetical protein
VIEITDDEHFADATVCRLMKEASQNSDPALLASRGEVGHLAQQCGAGQ